MQSVQWRNEVAPRVLFEVVCYKPSDSADHLKMRMAALTLQLPLRSKTAILVFASTQHKLVVCGRVACLRLLRTCDFGQPPESVQ